MLKKWLKKLAFLLALLYFFENRNIPVEKDSYRGWDVCRFQGTKAWNLAKAIDDQNIREIRRQVVVLKVPIDTKDRKKLFTPLMYAVFNNNIQSVKVLLELGADPNIPTDSISDKGDNSVIIASRYSDISIEILKLLLKYGGNPNSTECGRNYDMDGDWIPARSSALSCAVSISGEIEKVKILVEAGANVNNYDGDFQDAPLMDALLLDRMNIALYLLEHGADYNYKFRSCAPSSGGGSRDVDILYRLRQCIYPLDSQEYKDKLKVIKFLKDRGVDYRKSLVDVETKKMINNVMHFKTYKEYQNYLKRY